MEKWTSETNYIGLLARFCLWSVKKTQLHHRCFLEEIASHLPKSILTYHRFFDCEHGVIANNPDEAIRVVRRFVKQMETKS
ncbi:MAG: hypothetical protein AAFN63_11555 [Pseudomonadota bacterium]